MAGSKDPVLEKALLDYVFSGVAMPVLTADIYIEALTVLPTDGSAGTPVSGGGYARLAVTRNLTNFPAATGGGPSTKTNGVKLSWTAPASANWGTIVGLAAYSAATGGIRLYWGSVTAAKLIENGDTLEIPAGGWVAEEN